VPDRRISCTFKGKLKTNPGTQNREFLKKSHGLYVWMIKKIIIGVMENE
jgi:hypothetical protein